MICKKFEESRHSTDGRAPFLFRIFSNYLYRERICTGRLQIAAQDYILFLVIFAAEKSARVQSRR